MTTKTFWHVAPADYPGTDLLCWDALVERGLRTEADWQWPDAPVGMDGHVVCMFADTEEGRTERDWHLTETGGTPLRITLDDDDWMIEEVGEGYPCLAGSIPAMYIEVIR